MAADLQGLWQQGVKVLVIAVVPTLLIPAVGIVSSLLQGMLGAREESFQYAVRALTLAGVIVVFGASIASAFLELMLMALK
jgi:type III secretory pathway component EscS